MAAATLHIPWGSIGLLPNALINVKAIADGGPAPVVVYRAKIKLHGTNCAVQRVGAEVHAQSRTTMLGPGSDPYGFAAWVQAHRGYFVDNVESGLVVFGEWCGPGVQRGMAISQVTQRMFAVFAVRRDGRMVVDPLEIRGMLPAGGAPPELHVLPWDGEAFAVDFDSRPALDAVAATLSRRVEEVEREDPWVQRTFGISGVGEGVVLYPISVDGAPPPDDPEAYMGLMFKAKGEQHRTVGARAAVQVDPSRAASVTEFVDLVVTPARLEQGVAAVCGGAFGTAKIGKFLAWISADVRKETAAELAASGLTWPQVEKPVQQRARAWFLARRE